MAVLKEVLTKSIVISKSRITTTGTILHEMVEAGISMVEYIMVVAMTLWLIIVNLL